MSANERNWTLKEIDTELGLPKGAAMHAFKQLGQALVEDRDYLYTSGHTRPALIDALKDEGRLYRSSLHALQFLASGHAMITDWLRTHADDPTLRKAAEVAQRYRQRQAEKKA